MAVKLLLLFTIVPFLELTFLILLAGKVGYFPTVTLILFTGIIGSMMIRFQGVRTWLSARGEMSQGRFPADAMIDGLILIVGGALLITPGLLTDIAGFSTLIPAVRAIYRGRIKRFFTPRMNQGGTGGFKVFSFGNRMPRPGEQPPPQPEASTHNPFDEDSPFDRLPPKQ